MPKPLNPHCLSCVALSSAQAQQRSCWDGAVCHNRRSHYRRRLAQQAASAASTKFPAIPVIEVPLPDAIYAMLYCYNTQDHRLHAVVAELYRGEAIVVKTAPTHVGGLTERTLNLYLRNVLEAFSTHINSPVALFRDKVELGLDRHGCPVAGCPLKAIDSAPLEV